MFTPPIGSPNRAKAAKLGRPKTVSPKLIQEAALELFQLNGYDSTSIEEISRVAGFSRATFFNYFGAKAEIFWLETDQLLDVIEHVFSREESGDCSLEEVLIELSTQVSSEDIPWIFRHSDLISSREELLASGSARVLRLNILLERFLQSRNEKRLRAESFRYLAAVLAALFDWVDAGVGRTSLSDYLRTTLQ
ncbi:MAG: helix-turn-helix domain-containing protein [Microbacteriaceae bacterium]